MGRQLEPILSAYYNFYARPSVDRDQDITYYVELAKQTGGPVIELGCGIGRISIAIAQAGIDVIGVEFSAEKLAFAKQRAADLGLSDRIKWIESSSTNFQLPGTVCPLVIMPDRSFLQLVNVRDQLRTLKAIRRHLNDGGIFAFHAFVPHMRKLLEMEGKYTFRGTFPSGNEELEVYDFMELDTFNQLANITRYIERFDQQGNSIDRTKTKLRLRYIFPAELSHLLAVCGFKVEHRYGSFYRAPFEATSEELIVEAVKIVRR
jgi:ubiquinone/menaquinone biosynthesis C-methylase UbiE